MGREESVQRVNMNVWRLRVSKSVHSEMRVCCGCGFVFPRRVKWENLGLIT